MPKKLDKWRRGWWKKLNIEALAKGIVRFQEAMKKQLATNEKDAAFSWSYDVLVEANYETYFCGQACFVEWLSFCGSKSRLACFWTGERTPDNLIYGFVPSEFVLRPNATTLRQIWRPIIERVAGDFKAVTMATIGRERPASKNIVWYDVVEKGTYLLRFYSQAIVGRVRRDLLEAGIIENLEDDRADIVIAVEENILR